MPHIAWATLAATGPTKDELHPYYQAAYDPGTKTVYCLSGGPVLYAFHVVDKTWKTLPAPELEGLSWHALACDPVLLIERTSCVTPDRRPVLFEYLYVAASRVTYRLSLDR